MPKYRKKPIVVEAEQWFMGSDPEAWPVGVAWDKEKGRYFVTTIHGQAAYLDDGDWIITEPDGVHHYPCKPNIFEATYEAA